MVIENTAFKLGESAKSKSVNRLLKRRSPSDEGLLVYADGAFDAPLHKQIYMYVRIPCELYK